MSSIAPHQALYRRWRAQTFSQIVGQQPVVDTLRNAVRVGRTAQAYLFVGPRGTGKTSMARILAKALNCADLRDGEPCDSCPSCVAIREGRALDVTEMDAASNNRVDDIRDLLPRIYTAPSDLRRKVFIVDEVQRIREGWDVLLKTLEEPPEHVVFVFCTTDSSQIRPAVISRVQRFDFRRLTVSEIAGKLRTILEADGREAEPEAVELIARLAAGGMRDAESMLDQLLGPEAGPLTAAHVRDVLGLVDEDTLDAFLRALVEGDAIAGIERLDALEERGRDLRAFTEQAVERLRSALVAALGRGSPDPLAGAGVGPLAAATRRLAELDPAHAGPGGLRLQLELALLAPVEGVAPPAAALRAGIEPSASPAPHAGAATPRPAARAAAAPAAPASAAPAAPASAAAPTAPVAAERDATTAPDARRAPSGGEDRGRDRSAGRHLPAPPDAAATPAGAGRRAATPAPEPSQRPDRPERHDRPDRPDLQMLLERWAEIVAVISKHPPTKPLIEACRPVNVDGAVVTLGFPETQSFLKDVAERRKKVLEEGVGRVLGLPVTVRCVATNVELAELPPDPDSARLLTEFRRIYGDDAVDVGDVG